MSKIVSLFLLSLAGISSATAHHGLDNYNTTQLIEFEGRVVDFRLMDPHSVLVVETKNSDGTISTWEVEGGSASGIINSGISQNFLRSGRGSAVTKDLLGSHDFSFNYDRFP